MRRSPLETRFWAKVRKQPNDGCWEWTAFRTKQGYGVIRSGHKLMRTHRVSWELEHGPIPEAMDVLHKCDNPPCVRPDHLFIGTQLDNTMDCERKGRAVHPKREDHGRAKITTEQVLEMRRIYQLGGMSFSQIGKQFCVSGQLARAAILKINWKSV